MTLKLRVGRKGYIILPKAVREAVGIDEGDEVIVEIRDGILLKPAKKRVDVDRIKELLRAHAARLRSIQGRREPAPGEAAADYLEEEFES
ncbi:AbrB/MazE/SpoVT family DNA-binding domain-containing protein [Hyperthermus butylicus]|uniref:Conserved archaeal protein n=1 Tax=Hyperthermus butylicus (strain DSM 5456 / JCM 9403 / PLM1-5) TaxID=415426 RepID=A2BKV4_HYPBU|nr:AbrB/MazE/SpoVT family DNA-binding domain-containing protein [Hyperthermus butylicus]ABM80615.1 conserved archaeal protein [Hyperthermus butylicus DSM 5456]